MNLSSPDSLMTRKRDLRRLMMARRSEAASRMPEASLSLRDHFLKNISLPPKSIISAYNKMGDEMDLGPLITALRARGHVILFPAVLQKNARLIFRRVNHDDKFIEGVKGILEPQADKEVLEPDVVLTPLLAFDRRFYRLGYGGGYYDRTLSDLKKKKPTLAIGIAYACQEVPEIPTDSHDMRVDMVVTETGVHAAPR